MTAVRTSARPRVVAALLVLVLMLAGVGQGLAVAAEGGLVPPGEPGIGFPICHAGSGAGAPAAPVHHACCDACALLSMGIVAAPPVLFAPAWVVRSAIHAVPRAARPALARARTPRQAQGPPAA